MGFLSRNTATLVSSSWRLARNQQTTRVKCHPEITDAAAITLANGCPNLDYIELNPYHWRYRVDAEEPPPPGEVFRRFRFSSSWEHYRCYTEITDVGVTAFAKTCRKLTHITLHRCYTITDAAVTALATHCPSLTTMDLKFCSNITDAAVIALATHCPNLASSRPLAFTCATAPPTKPT